MSGYKPSQCINMLANCHYNCISLAARSIPVGINRLGKGKNKGAHVQHVQHVLDLCLLTYYPPTLCLQDGWVWGENLFRLSCVMPRVLSLGSCLELRGDQ